MLVFSQKVWKKMCSYSYNFHIPICTRSPPIGSGQLLPIPAWNLEIFLCFVRTTVSTLIRAICTRVHITSHPDVGLKWTYLPLKCAIRPALLPSHGDACDDDHHDDNAFLFSTIFFPTFCALLLFTWQAFCWSSLDDWFGKLIRYTPPHLSNQAPSSPCPCLSAHERWESKGVVESCWYLHCTPILPHTSSCELKCSIPPHIIACWRKSW